MTRTLTLDAVETLANDCLTACGASPLQSAAVARSIRDAEAEGTRGIGLGYLPWYCRHLKVGKIVGHRRACRSQGSTRRGAGGRRRRLFASRL